MPEKLFIRWLKETKKNFNNKVIFTGMPFQLIFKLKLVECKFFRRCAGVISMMQPLFKSSSCCIGKVVTMRRRRELAGSKYLKNSTRGCKKVIL